MEYEKLLPNYDKIVEIEEIKEKLLEKSARPTSLEEIEKIEDQMINNPICIIYGKDKKGNGFFTKIPFPDNKNLLPVLMTNNHIIDELYFKNNSEIIISLKNDNKIKLELKDRIKYTDKDYDITIIEIKENKDNINFFLELDDNINKSFYYKNETIYNLQYYCLQSLKVSFGIITENIKEHYFKHFCNTQLGSSGSPILFLSTNKVIGIHKASSKNCNIGLFLNKALIDFNEKNKDKMKQYQNGKSFNVNRENPHERTKLDLREFWNMKKFIT